MRRALIWLRTPRTGGTSLRAALERSGLLAWEPEDGKIVCVEGGRGRVAGFIRRHPDYWAKAFKFAVVRNPWDRFLSGWKDCIRGLSMLEVLRDPPLPSSFHQWHHVARTQCGFLVGDDGHLLVDHLVRFENLQANLDRVMRLNGFPPVLLDHLNATRRPRDYRDAYDEQTRHLAAVHFQQDLARFAYQFEEPIGATESSSPPRPWSPPVVARLSSQSNHPSDAEDDGGGSDVGIPYENTQDHPPTIVFRFEDRIGTFANINAFLYFCAQKDQHVRVLLADNEVLAAKTSLASGRLIDIVGTPFSPRNRKKLKPVLGELPRAGEHMRAATYQRADLDSRRRQLHGIFHEGFRFSEEPVRAAGPLLVRVRQQPTLGVHMRFTRHYSRRLDYAAYIASFQTEIDRRMSRGDYCQLFVATHMAEALAAMQQRYGSRVLHYEQYRNPDPGSDWMGNKPMDQERREVVIDMHLLASCGHIIGGPSNVFYAALWYRPRLSFSIVPILRGVNSG